MGVGRDGPPATDALLERRIDGSRERGKSVKSALRAITAVAWDARWRGLASPVGPLTKAALKRLRRMVQAVPVDRVPFPRPLSRPMSPPWSGCGRTWALSRPRMRCWRSSLPKPLAQGAPQVRRRSTSPQQFGGRSAMSARRQKALSPKPRCARSRKAPIDFRAASPNIRTPNIPTRFRRPVHEALHPTLSPCCFGDEADIAQSARASHYH